MLKRNNSSIIIIIRHRVSITNTLSLPLNNRYLLYEISSYACLRVCERHSHIFTMLLILEEEDEGGIEFSYDTRIMT